MLTSLGLGALRWCSAGVPEPFLDGRGHPLAGSLSEKVRIRVTGVEQGMVIRGQDESNPVLLWVHGGPGMPDYFLTQDYPTGLEDLFTIVWWDQRGAGLSFHVRHPGRVHDHRAVRRDTLSVTDYLRDGFGQDRIYLLGHSWGSLIAVQAAARSPKRYAAYLGMAQVVHQLESEKLAYDHMLAAYRQRGDARMVHRLEATPVTMTGGTPRRYLKVRDAAMHRLGIGTTHDMGSVISAIFVRSLRFRGYTPGEKLALWRGRRFSRGLGLWEQLIRIDLRETVPELQVPVHLLEGKHDYTAITSLARDYLEKLRAPVKELHLFEHSAHSPLLEEPGRGHDVLEQLLAGRGSWAEVSRFGVACPGSRCRGYQEQGRHREEHHPDRDRPDHPSSHRGVAGVTVAAVVEVAGLDDHEQPDSAQEPDRPGE